MKPAADSADSTCWKSAVDDIVGRATGPSNNEESIRKTLRVLMGILLGICVVTCFTKFFDEDEFQAMVIAVNMADGKQLYVDIWDNHGPLLNYVLAFFYRHWGWPGHSIMFMGRLFSLIHIPLILLFYLKMIREIRTSPSFFPELACVLLLFSSLFTQIGIEVRADIPLLLAWTATLFLWHRGRSRRQASLFFLGGLVIGCGFWLSFKTLVLGAAVGLMFLVDMLAERRVMWRRVLMFGLGSAVMPLCLALFLKHVDLLGPFLEHYIFQNTDRTHESALIGMGKLLLWDPVCTPVLVFSLLAGAWACWKRHFPKELMPSLVCAWGLFVQLIFLLPTHNEQSALPMLIPASLVEAWFLILVAGKLRLQRFPWLNETWNSPLKRTTVLALLLIGLSAVINQWPIPAAMAKIRWADRMLEEIEPGAYVLDGAGLPLFRPKIVPYLNWVNTLRDRLREGTLPIDLVTRMDETDLRYVIRDERTPSMGEKVNRFIDANYIPSTAERLWVAGMRVPHEGKAQRTITLRIAGSYFWKVNGPGADHAEQGEEAAPVSEDASSSLRTADGAPRLILDGRPAPNPVTLEDGEYRVSWEGTGDLILSTAEPHRWKSM